MGQTIDLRKKIIDQPTEPPKEKPEPVLPQPKPVEKEPEPTSLKPSSSVISWSTVMSPLPKKKIAWWTLGVLSAIGVLMLMFRHDIFFSIMLFLAGFVIVLRAYSKPRRNNISVTPTSIIIDEERYPFHEMKSFWVRYQPPQIKELSVEFKKSLRPYLNIPLEGTDPLEIRSVMVQYIPEKEHEETLFDQIIRMIGF